MGKPIIVWQFCKEQSLFRLDARQMYIRLWQIPRAWKK